MLRIYELRQKEIINIKDGCRYGYITDLEIDETKGTVTKIIIPGPAKVFGVFGREQEYHIEWDSIKQFGEDVILVEVDTSEALTNLES